jgi:hypothetical protein
MKLSVHVRTRFRHLGTCRILRETSTWHRLSDCLASFLQPQRKRVDIRPLVKMVSKLKAELVSHPQDRLNHTPRDLSPPRLMKLLPGRWFWMCERECVYLASEANENVLLREQQEAVILTWIVFGGAGVITLKTVLPVCLFVFHRFSKWIKN